MGGIKFSANLGFFHHDRSLPDAILATKAAGFAAVAEPNSKLMFDCYHVGRTEGDVVIRIKALLPMIGHIQFASVPERGTPDRGELNFSFVFDAIKRLGWEIPLGAECKYHGSTDDSLSWMNSISGAKASRS